MRDLIIFIPSIEGGGVEKNLFYITKYIQLYQNIFTLYQILYNNIDIY